MRHPAPCIGNERGFSVILLALLIFGITFMLGIALDAGYLYLVKGELQNAADAGALAGAGVIYPRNAYPPPTAFPEPDFVHSEVVAKAFVKHNSAAGRQLNGSDIENIDAGYWNLDGTPGQMPSEEIVPTGACSGTGMRCATSAQCTAGEVCLMRDLPAVLVTVKKAVPMFFATAFGVDSFEVKATAVAARGFPRTGHPFPIAVSRCMVENYFSQPLPTPPTEIKIWGAYNRVPGCNTGQWTSLTMGSNSAAVIRELMYSTPAPLSIGDTIQISAGNMEGLYGSLQQDFAGKEVQLPVVQDPRLSTNSITPVTGFVRFRIDRVVGNEVYGHLLAYYDDRLASNPGGPTGNIATPPALVR